MRALISDVHGNLKALDAVENQTAGLEIICLGDVVCYGPDSIECVRRSGSWHSVVAGPLDTAMLDHRPDQWSPTINATIQRLRKRFSDSPDARELFETIASYQSEFTSNGILHFHGVPGNVRDWIFPEEIYCGNKLDRIANHSQHAFIGGGSHIPGIFRRIQSNWEFTTPQNGKTYDLPTDEKTIVTLGSVGQPRDTDPRAAYAILDDTSITFHRVDYDTEETRRKIEDDPDTENIHGARLPGGR